MMATTTKAKPRRAGRRTTAKLLTPAEEIALAKRVERGDLKAKERMVEANVGLVHAMVPTWTRRGVSYEDLVQEGMIGLIRAVEKFDWRPGWRFSTYATWWIRQSVSRAVYNQRTVIRYPERLWRRHHHLVEVAELLADELGRPPTDAEVAEAAGTSERDVVVSRTMGQPVASLESALGDSDVSLLERLAAPDDGEHALTSEAARALAVTSALERLDARSREVVRRHFGLGDGGRETFPAIASRLSLSAERVRQLERDAFTRLRDEPAVQELRDVA